jgi:hypothetical protein
MALVSQEPVLFARSVRRNVVYGLEPEDGAETTPGQVGGGGGSCGQQLRAVELTDWPCPSLGAVSICFDPQFLALGRALSAPSGKQGLSFRRPTRLPNSIKPNPATGGGRGSRTPGQRAHVHRGVPRRLRHRVRREGPGAQRRSKAAHRHSEGAREEASGGRGRGGGRGQGGGCRAGLLREGWAFEGRPKTARAAATGPACH